jgi:hypothetical protein
MVFPWYSLGLWYMYSLMYSLGIPLVFPNVSPWYSLGIYIQKFVPHTYTMEHPRIPQDSPGFPRIPQDSPGYIKASPGIPKLLFLRGHWFTNGYLRVAMGSFWDTIFNIPFYIFVPFFKRGPQGILIRSYGYKSGINMITKPQETSGIPRET